MPIPNTELATRRDAILRHCYATYGLDPVLDNTTGMATLTAGSTEIRLVLTDGAMHVTVQKTAGPPLGSNNHTEGLKHGILTKFSQVWPSLAVDITGQRIKQVWLTHGTAPVHGLFWLSARNVRDISKVEAVVIAMIDVALVAGMDSEE